MPIKIFCDTSILLNQKFHPKNYLDVRTSIVSIEELDGLKKDKIIGYKARDAIKKLKNATNVYIEKYYDFSFENKFLSHKNDNFILGFAYQTWKEDNDFIFLTDDFNLYLKSVAIGVPCDLFEFKEVEEDKYNGIREVFLTNRECDKLLESEDNPLKLSTNEYIIIKNTSKNEEYLYIWNDAYFEEIKKVKPINNKYVNYKDAIVPLDLYQKAFIHMLQNEDVKVKITDSGYGCGKSFLMLHWALQQLDNGSKYNKLFFAKSDSPPKGRKEFPAVPGDVKAKTDHLMGVICDVTSEDRMSDFTSVYNKVEVMPIQMVKGRSLRKSILYINECQDFTPSEMERLLSRIGEDTVVLLDGSTKQIDNKNCLHKNGLTVASENFKNKAISAQVNMINDYRSDISKMVSEMDWSD